MMLNHDDGTRRSKDLQICHHVEKEVLLIAVHDYCIATSKCTSYDKIINTT